MNTKLVTGVINLAAESKGKDKICNEEELKSPLCGDVVETPVGRCSHVFCAGNKTNTFSLFIPIKYP